MNNDIRKGFGLDKPDEKELSAPLMAITMMLGIIAGLIAGFWIGIMFLKHVIISIR